ncbi:MAG: 30S ribosomal protein S5 [bacterium]|nr:30S ribosomal protein S5 [bacterium]
MIDTKPTTIEEGDASLLPEKVVPVAPASPAFADRRRRTRAPRGGGGGGDRRGGGARRGGREDRVRPEFDQKTLAVRRVARVVAGGRRFSFSVLIVIGNRKGKVGVGLGKAGDTAAAIDKATKDAKKQMLTLPLTASRSIPFPVEAKYSSAELFMMPAPRKGLIAGSAVRTVLELGGVTDVNAKILSGSKNKLNIARATIKALSELKAPKGNTESRSSNNEKV